MKRSAQTVTDNGYGLSGIMPLHSPGGWGALLYSPVDFTWTLWCIGGINRWIKQRTRGIIVDLVGSSSYSRWLGDDTYTVRRSSSSFSASGMSRVMRYINARFLLTYLLTCLLNVVLSVRMNTVEKALTYQILSSQTIDVFSICCWLNQSVFLLFSTRKVTFPKQLTAVLFVSTEPAEVK